MAETNEIAPDGQIWVCLKCGKRSKDRRSGNQGWDAGCFSNAILCLEDKLIIEDDEVVVVKNGGCISDDRPLEETVDRTKDGKRIFARRGGKHK